MLDWPPSLLVLLALTLAQLGLFVVARLLDRRVRRSEVVLAWVLVLVLLAPWLSGQRLLMPIGSLAQIGQLALEDSAISALPEGDDVWALQSDAVLQFLPFEVEVRRALRQGRLPWWSDRLVGGSPPWVNPSAEVFSPVAMIARLAPLQHHFLLAVAVKLLIAIQGAALLARVLGARPGATLLAGVGFGLGGGMLAWLMFPHTSTAPWMAWHAVAVVGLVRRRGALGAELLRAAGATMVLLIAGHPETGLGGGMLSGVLALAVARRGDMTRRMALAGVAAALGVGLAAPMVVPTLHAVHQSQRYVDRVTAEPSGELFHDHGEVLFKSLVNPFGAGRPYGPVFEGRYNWCEGLVPYVGVVAWAALATAVVAGGWAARSAAVFSLLSLLAASGFRPLMRALHAVPGFELVTWERMMLAGALATALAGALVASKLWHRPRWPAAAAVLAAAGVSLLVNADPEVWWRWLGVGLGLALASVPRPWRRLAWPTLVVVAAVDLLTWAGPQIPRGRPEWFFPQTPLIELLNSSVAHPSPSRVVGEGFALYPHQLAIYGLEDLRGHDPLMRADLARSLGSVFEFAPTWEQYFAPFLNVEHPFLDALNVSTVVSNHQMRERRGLVRRGAGSRHTVWFNRGVLPRWFIASQTDVIEPDGLPEYLRRLRDPRHVAVGPGSRGVVASLGTTLGRVWPAGERVPGRERLLLDPADEPRLLATSLTWPEGWAARSNKGLRLQTLVVNGAFLGVVVPANTTELELRFVPPGQRLGFALGAVSWMLAAWIWWRRAR